MKPHVAGKDRKERHCQKFNDECPTGTNVIYTKDDGTEIRGAVKYAATMLGGHTPVVWIEGVTGCVALSRVRKPEHSESIFSPQAGEKEEGKI